MVTTQNAPERKPTGTDHAGLEKSGIVIGIDSSETDRTVLDRKLLYALTLLIVITLVAAISITVLSSINRGQNNHASVAGMLALQDKARQLRNDLQATQLEVEILKQEIIGLRTQLENSSAVAIQSLMLEQENSYQTFIRELRQGMYDLSRMVPGSRTWLAIYSKKMDEISKASDLRQQQLHRLIRNETVIEP